MGLLIWGCEFQLLVGRRGCFKKKKKKKGEMYMLFGTAFTPVRNTWMCVMCSRQHRVHDTQSPGFPPRCCSLVPRGCTDIICCVFLLLAIVGYVAVGVIGEWKRAQGWGSKVGGGQATASRAGTGMMLRDGRASVSLDPSTAWTHGDPRKVIYPTDSRGEFCGQKGTKNA